MTASKARASLVAGLQFNLVGPWPGHPFASELLPGNPTRRPCTGDFVLETAVNIFSLRALNAAMDAAVLTAYGWTDLLPQCICEFLLDYEEDPPSPGGYGAAGEEEGKSRNRKKPWRYRWPDEVRDEVLARLLKLNAERSEEERLAGQAAAVSGEGKLKTKSKGVRKRSQSLPGQGDLSAPTPKDLFG